MRILIASIELLTKGEKYMDDKGWSFGKAFEKLGHNVKFFCYKKKGRLAFLEKEKYIRDIWRFFMNRQLLAAVRKMKPDMLFVITGNTIEPETLQAIRKKTDTLLINIFTDNPFLFMRKFESIEPYHYFFVKDTYICTILKKAGLKNILYLPQCTNPDIYRPVKMDEEERSMYAADVSLIGSMYPYRLKLVEQLVEFKPALWGKGWSKSSNLSISTCYRGNDIRGSAKAKAICASSISLNPHHPLNDIYGTNSRTFDISACRGFQLADYKSDMESLLKVNEEIVCFRDMDELKKLVRYYLGHPDECAQIAEAAYKRVVEEHTYYERARQILNVVGVAG